MKSHILGSVSELPYLDYQVFFAYQFPPQLLFLLIFTLGVKEKQGQAFHTLLRNLS